MNLGVIIPLVQALVTCQLQREHSSQFFLWWHDMKMAYARKFSLHVLITAFNLFFSSAPLICKYDTKLWCHIIDLFSIIYFVCDIHHSSGKIQSIWNKIMMTLIIVHRNHDKRKVEKEKLILEKRIRPLGQPLTGVLFRQLKCISNVPGRH